VGGADEERERDQPGGECDERASDDHAGIPFAVAQVYDPGNFSPNFAPPARRTA
jgi:hypothetical protein